MDFSDVAFCGHRRYCVLEDSFYEESGVNIRDLGAIGEIVGAFAVVLTLVYLARQIRENA